MSSALPWKYKSNLEEPIVFSCRKRQGIGGLFESLGVLDFEEMDEKEELLTSSSVLLRALRGIQRSLSFNKDAV
jgi:hypothetical protein